MEKRVLLDEFISCVVSSKVIAMRRLVLIPVCKLLQESKGYRMGQPGKRDVKRTHSLLVDHLQVYQESHKTLRDVNKMIVQASNVTCY